MFSYNSLAEIAEAAERLGASLSDVALADQAAAIGIPEGEVMARMRENLEVMRRSAREGLRPGLRSVSGLSGGDGLRISAYAAGGRAIGGPFGAKASALAIGIQEYNAAMGKIVAAPTAGSCGILPAGVITMMEERGASEDAATRALIAAGAVGMVIATVATVSGAEGGCQAECGSAAAMTAAALAELSGGSPSQAAHAAAIALQNLLGLACDPVAGLVEIPCILRNGCGIAVAISAADMALADVKSAIPVDEVIRAMGEVGRALPASLRETAQGGLAATPTGMAMRERLFGGRGNSGGAPGG